DYRRAARQLATARDELEQRLRRREGAVRRWREHVLADGNAADAHDFLIHLDAKQDAAMRGLGALAQLQLDHLDDIPVRLLAIFLGMEAAILGATAEIAGADLPDKIAAARKVIRADAPLPGVMRKAAAPRAGVQRMDRGRGKRAETHARDIETRGVIGLAALRPADIDAQMLRHHIARRERMAGALVADLEQVRLGSERLAVENAAGALVDHAALQAVIGAAALVGLDEILLDLRADELQQIAHMADDGIIAQHVMAREIHVIDAKQDIGHQDPEEIDDRRPEKLEQKDCQQTANGYHEKYIAGHRVVILPLFIVTCASPPGAPALPPPACPASGREAAPISQAGRDAAP